MKKKVFRLFVSSTFSDFIEERTVLNDKILPVLEKYCKKKGYYFQMIDLRWGVNTESGLNQKTLDICLDEVRRCKKYSLKPNFLIMLGNRYGWIPLPTRIVRMEFEQILEVSALEERELLLTWYKLDENAIDTEYYLKPRDGIYLDYEYWSQMETSLLAILERGASKCEFSFQQMKKYITSATEHEIIEGIWNIHEECSNAIAVFREEYSDNERNSSRVTELKNKLRFKFEENHQEECLLTLQYGEGYLEEFYERLLNVLITEIDCEIDRFEKLECEEEKKKTQEIALNQEKTFFYGRISEIEQLKQYTENHDNRILLLTGTSGSGKTSLLKQFLIQCSRSIICSFWGMTEESYTLVNAINSICREIRERFHCAQISVNENNITQALWETLLLVPEDEDLVLIIDGLDTFYDFEKFQRNLFPRELPYNVKMIVSAVDGSLADTVLENAIVFELNSFSESDNQHIFTELLKGMKRQVVAKKQTELLESVFRKKCTPLYLKLLASLCSKWHSDEILLEIPQSAEDVVLEYIENMYKHQGHDKELVLYALAFIAVAPYGITETELQEVLLTVPSVRENFLKEDRYNYSKKRLPFSVWSRLFYDLENCLTLAHSKVGLSVQYNHYIFYYTMKNVYSQYCEFASDSLIRWYYSQPHYIDMKTAFPNVQKLYSLPELLRRKGDIGRLQGLYEDIYFIDASVRAGELENVISNLIFLIDKVNKNDKISGYLSCLHNNRSMLICYKDSFQMCAEAEGIFDSKKQIISYQKQITSQTQIESLYFPFDEEEKIVWSLDGSRYAVISGTYIYIYDRKKQTEQYCIFLPAFNREWNLEDSENVIKFFWMNNNLAAAVTESGMIYCLQFQNIKIRHVFTKKCQIKRFTPYYCRKSQLFFWVEKNLLYAFDPQTEQYRYKINLDCQNPIIHLIDGKIYIKKAYGKKQCYDAASGRILKVEIPRFLINSNGKYCDFICLEDKNWIKINFGGYVYPIFTIFNKKGNGKYKKYSLSLLRKDDYLGKLAGEKTIIWFYNEVIICINLKTKNQISVFKAPDIKNVSWVIKDRSISFSSSNRLFIVSLEDFMPVPAEISSLIISKYSFWNIFYERFALKELKKDVSYLIKIKNILKYYFEFLLVCNKGGNYKDFKYVEFKNKVLFSFDAEEKKSELEMMKDVLYDKSTLVSISNDGTLAVAYEGADAISLFDENGQEFLVLDHLNLSIQNSLLKMEFSKDSRYLLIWRSLSVVVLNLKNSRCILEVNIAERKIKNIFFDEIADSLNIVLNDQLLNYKLGRKKRKINLSSKNEQYVSKEMRLYLDMVPFQNDNSLKMRIKRSYQSEKQGVIFRNGQFFDQNDEKIVYETIFCDFKKCLENDYMQKKSRTYHFLKEKNDMYNSLIAYGNKYCVLVSRILNSIIIFDHTEKKIIKAYKHHGNIIGARFLNDTQSVELISDQKPHRMIFEINLSDKIS